MIDQRPPLESLAFVLNLELFKVTQVRIRRPHLIKARFDDKPCLSGISRFYMFYLSNSHGLVSNLRPFNNVNFYYLEFLVFQQTFVLVIMIKQQQQVQNGIQCIIPFQRCRLLG